MKPFTAEGGGGGVGGVVGENFDLSVLAASVAIAALMIIREEESDLAISAASLLLSSYSSRILRALSDSGRDSASPAPRNEATPAAEDSAPCTPQSSPSKKRGVEKINFVGSCHATSICSLVRGTRVGDPEAADDEDDEGAEEEEGLAFSCFP